jgi:hypothetical protein
VSGLDGKNLRGSIEESFNDQFFIGYKTGHMVCGNPGCAFSPEEEISEKHACAQYKQGDIKVCLNHSEIMAASSRGIRTRIRLRHSMEQE